MKVFVSEDQSCWYELKTLPAQLHISIDDENWQHLLSQKPLNTGKIKFFGREANCPRYFQQFGKDYPYSGIIAKGKIEFPYLKMLAEYCKKDSGEGPFNGTLINWYMDKSQKMGLHADSESCLIPDKPIYSVSFGDSCQFEVLAKKKFAESHSNFKLTLSHNSVLVMGGQFQKRFKHQVPAQIGRGQNSQTKIRINLTLRCFK